MATNSDLNGSRTAIDAQRLARNLAKYADPKWPRAVFELAVTAGGLVASWALMWLSLGVGYWLTLLLAIPAAGFLIRLFMIQHDCGHRAFLRQRSANDWLGRVLGVFTFTPYDYWKHDHIIHHATSGNLDRRGVGDIMTLTVGEYYARPWWGRLAYRAYRHPLVLFGIGPAYLFLLQQRLPLGQMRNGWRPWLATLATNAGIAVLVVAMMVWTGVGTFVAIHLPIMLLAASMGVWLFYIQHQFEAVVWSRGAEWSQREAALWGSSHYDLPAPFRWFTANIGVHHVHHLSSRIPFYRLQEVLRDHPQLRHIGRVTPRQSLRSVGLALWDEAARKLVSFRDARAVVAQSR